MGFIRREKIVITPLVDVDISLVFAYYNKLELLEKINERKYEQERKENSKEITNLGALDRKINREDKFKKINKQIEKIRYENKLHLIHGDEITDEMLLSDEILYNAYMLAYQDIYGSEVRNFDNFVKPDEVYGAYYKHHLVAVLKVKNIKLNNKFKTKLVYEIKLMDKFLDENTKYFIYTEVFNEFEKLVSFYRLAYYIIYYSDTNKKSDLFTCSLFDSGYKINYNPKFNIGPYSFMKEMVNIDLLDYLYSNSDDDLSR